MAGDIMGVRDMLRKAARMAMKDAMKSTVSKGKKVARSIYDIKMKDQKALHAREYQASLTHGEVGEVEFYGGMGDPLRYFPALPKRGKPKWKGINPRQRTPIGGTMFRIKKGSPYKVRKGPHGESTFWFRGNTHGKYLIGYREKSTGKISTWDMFGASQIQAIGREDKSREISAHFAERYETRLDHYMDAYSKGIIR